MFRTYLVAEDKYQMREFINLIENNFRWLESINGFDLADAIADQGLHHTPEDFDYGDIRSNISSFGMYHLKRIPIADLKPDLYTYSQRSR